jgi:phage tail sheath protein FI
MAVAVSYPGVYIEEVPSGVRTITGVATSITAFVGWARKGRTDRAEQVLSWADFERKCGGLDPDSPLSYGVYQFFNNGGSQAYVVRVASSSAAAAKQTSDGVTIEANSPGKWGERYGFKKQNFTDEDGKARFGITVFRLTAAGAEEAAVESFENLSADPNDPRFFGAVINSASGLITAKAAPAPPPPDEDAPEDEILETEGPEDEGEADEEAAPPLVKLAGGNDGSTLKPGEEAFLKALLGTDGTNQGVKHLERVDLFNILCVPGESDAPTIQALEKFCRDHRAFLIADSSKDATAENLASAGPGAITGADAINAAFYFPWVLAGDPLQGNRPREFPPSGFAAGIYARTDATRGVWKAPAGTDASLTGAVGVLKPLTDGENGTLNPKAINCIRNFDVYGTILWGARTLRGNNELGSEWKYIPVRRTALFLEESLYRALKWVVFEPNDEPLWAQIRLNVGAFMHNLFRQGAFQGSTPKDAYFVKCDKETTTQNDINLGIVNIHVGFAPLKPAEFVVVKLQQMAGQIEV